MSDAWVETSKGCVAVDWEQNSDDYVSYTEEDGLRARYPEFAGKSLDQFNDLVDAGVLQRCIRCELWVKGRDYQDGSDVCKFCDMDRGR
jgi:hypothetical protein